MKVDLNIKEGYCEVIKETGDPNFRSGGWGDAESTFLHHVKKELQKQGFDVIKKRMWKDGHMVDDTQQYIRTRSGLEKPEDFAIYNSQYAVCDMGERFNIDGLVDLAVITGE